MPNVIVRPSWWIPERRVTDCAAVFNRRQFLNRLGLASGGLVAAATTGCSRAAEPAKPVAGVVPANEAAAAAAARRYPAPRNPDFSPPWKLTEEKIAARYNNFYEFTLDKSRVSRMAASLVTAPWPIQIGGLIDNPMTIDAAELTGLMTLEERVYRFRCVEAWAMIVPWTGFPLRALVEKVRPKSEAKFIRFETFNRPDQAMGMMDKSYPWPYFEGLRLDEALHPLTLVATGIYGKPLPNQHGAPLRLVVPWKYGYKSIKSIVKIDFVAAQPKTFWETMAPHEYPFESNVNPAIPHPRWSQATERMIDTGDRVNTLPFNGYGDQVAKLYAG